MVLCLSCINLFQKVGPTSFIICLLLWVKYNLFNLISALLCLSFAYFDIVIGGTRPNLYKNVRECHFEIKVCKSLTSTGVRRNDKKFHWCYCSSLPSQDLIIISSLSRYNMFNRQRFKLILNYRISNSLLIILSSLF